MIEGNTVVYNKGEFDIQWMHKVIEEYLDKPRDREIKMYTGEGGMRMLNEALKVLGSGWEEVGISYRRIGKPSRTRRKDTRIWQLS